MRAWSPANAYPIPWRADVPRRLAWELLRSSSLTPLRDLDAAAEHVGLDARDRGFARRLVGTEVRRRGTLRALVRHFARGKPSRETALHLHLGLVQAFFMDRVPDHAIVSETVRTVHDSMGPSKVRYVNGVLRSALRARLPGSSGDPCRDLVGRDWHLEEPIFRDPVEHPYLWAEDALSVPAPLMKRFAKRFGEEEARALARVALAEPPLSVRVVTGDRAETMAQLEAAGLHPRPGTHAGVFLMPAAEAPELSLSEAFAAGRVTIQGESALRAAEAVQASEGERVLDLCAAPGGKTAVLAAAGASVTACDVSSGKLERLGETVQRLGVAERVELCLASELDQGDFDAVLVDAPCTNTGVLAQRPEARWRYGPKTKRDLLAVQAQLLARGAELVRPGGRLVWSTCALESDENARAVKTFMAEHPGWSLEEEAEALPGFDTDQEGGAGPIDGGYFARLRLKG